MLRVVLDLGLLERADHDRAQEPGEDERGVPGGLAPPELEVGGGHVQRHPAELRDPHLRADPGARRRLAEDQPHGAAGEDPELLPPSPLDLQLPGETECQLELVRAPGGDPREAPAFQRVGDIEVCHGAMLLREDLIDIR